MEVSWGENRHLKERGYHVTKLELFELVLVFGCWYIHKRCVWWGWGDFVLPEGLNCTLVQQRPEQRHPGRMWILKAEVTSRPLE